MPATASQNGHSRALPGSTEKKQLLKVNELGEHISNKPSFAIRWGVTILFFIALFFLAVTWFIRYPEVVEAKGLLTSVNAPKEVSIKARGKLVKLLVSEQQQVERNQVLACLESTASHDEVIRLSRMLDSLAARLKHSDGNELHELRATALDSLGELQSLYQVFFQSLEEYDRYLDQGFYLRKRKMLFADLGYLDRLHGELLRQKDLLSQDLGLSDSTFQSNQFLREQKVISAFDLRNEKSRLLAKQMSLPQISSLIISNRSQQHEKRKEIAELENQIDLQKNIFLQALNTLRSQVDDWKMKYLLISPIKGAVSFSSFLQENQELKEGQLFCYINPDNTVYYAEVLIPQYNFGKVKPGQQALLKIPAYPWQEFGPIEARIEFISTVPTDSGYLAKVSLPKGLLTTYKKTLQYRTGLFANTEIITKDRRLLERFFQSFRFGDR